MAQPQTVTGVFDNVAEAQQAVQHLLAAGFTSDHIHFSAPPRPPASTSQTPDSKVKKQSTGHFFSSLFGHKTPAGHQDADHAIHVSTAVVTVQVQSALDADRAVGSLTGAATVTVNQAVA